MKLDIASLEDAFAKGVSSPVTLIAKLLQRIDERGSDGVWLSRFSRDQLIAFAEEAENGPRAPNKPLAGIPFAVKDNIDVAGLPTTAACPSFAYHPQRSATVVERLVAAGAVPLGKTNLDQFATGLVGVRSPYGVARNPFGEDYIPGGSSSGSAVAVAAGLCSFALGTDTAGSGRVPAAFNKLVGLKPSRGLLSNRGLVPACRSLDCISIFSNTVADAARVLSVAAAPDSEDPWSRSARPPLGFTPAAPTLGVPKAAQLEFFGDRSAARLFAEAQARFASLGAKLVEIDLEPFLAAARLLYEGPWVAERHAAIKDFLARAPSALHPVTRAIIEPAGKLGAVSAFEAFYKLAELRARCDEILAGVDALLLPTTPTCYTIAQVEAEPVTLNSRLGYYTNFMNLLDLCGLALPVGLLDCGIPWGVTLAAPAFHDDRLLAFGAAFLGEKPPAPALRPEGPFTQLAVCGAHLSGLPLNWQLTSLGARLLKRLSTSPDYKLFALPGTVPPKPGLLRTQTGGSAIEVEVWEISTAAYGYFVSKIPAPLGIGTLRLSDGSQVQGFLCEASAVEGAEDITHLGGWRAYLSR